MRRLRVHAVQWDDAPTTYEVRKPGRGTADDYEPGECLCVFETRAEAEAFAAGDDARRAAWWALVMCAAASIEDAANCLRDADAKKQADGAAKHYREAAQKLMAAPGEESCRFAQQCNEEGSCANGCEERRASDA